MHKLTGIIPACSLRTVHYCSHKKCKDTIRLIFRNKIILVICGQYAALNLNSCEYGKKIVLKIKPSYN
jgi:hypothetical protein